MSAMYTEKIRIASDQEVLRCVEHELKNTDSMWHIGAFTVIA